MQVVRIGELQAHLDCQEFLRIFTGCCQNFTHVIRFLERQCIIYQISGTHVLDLISQSIQLLEHMLRLLPLVSRIGVHLDLIVESNSQILIFSYHREPHERLFIWHPLVVDQKR